MNHELAKTLTTALVQFIDRERPEGVMCCSNTDCANLENAFNAENFVYIEAYIKMKLLGLTEFEDKLVAFALQCDGQWDIAKEEAKKWSRELLTLAKKELCSLCDEHLKGFSEGYDKANENKSYRFPTMPTSIPLCWEPGGTCTNPHMDCINCPKKTTGGGFNTVSGTLTLKAEE